MNVFHRFTLMSLKKNRSRTLVTIIGIVLSMSLITAVIEGAYSGKQYLIRAETARAGAFHGYYSDLDDDAVKEITSDKEIKDYAVWKEVGWADIGSENKDKPYLLIKSVSSNFTDMVAVNIIEGRMPENDKEILLPEHLRTNGKVIIKTGDEITLSVGKRVSEGDELYASVPFVGDGDESIEDTEDKTYRVVGTYARFSSYMGIESYICPGYTALTYGDADGRSSVFFTLEKPSKFYDFVLGSDHDYGCVPNSDLLMYSGSFRNSGFTRILYGFAAVLVFIIAFGSVSLIYNSFSVSVSERTKQFGILKSVGATRKQIKSTVLYEAMILCGIAVPLGMIIGCAGIGITLLCLRDSFSFIFDSFDSGANIKMYLVLNPPALVLSALVCTAVTLISAWIPAKRAIKISAIDAIRQSNDIKIKGKDVKTPKLVQKIAGFEGMLAFKNFKRNKKRYRSTVMSLFLSIVLFISASSFCSYLTVMVGGISSARGYEGADICYDYWPQDNSYDTDELFKILSSVEGVSESEYVQVVYTNFAAENKVLEDSFLNAVPVTFVEPHGSSENTSEFHGKIDFLEDEAFRRYCTENGISPEKYFDSSSPKGLICNKIVRNYSENNISKYYSTDILKAESLPVTLDATMRRNFPGYNMVDSETDDDNRVISYTFCKEEYLDEYYNGDDIDESYIKVIYPSEFFINTKLTIGGIIEKKPDSDPYGEITTIIYPVSMRKYLYIDDATIAENHIYSFKADDHRNVYEKLRSTLIENGFESDELYNRAEEYEGKRTMIKVINVFSYGFIILISLIAIANVFNTISTNIMLRRREFAMLKSVGFTNGGFNKMMNLECVIYGLKSILWGLPASVVVTYIIYKITDMSYEAKFYIPWYSIAVSVGSVFVVVFATMFYATHKIKGDNPIDALKNENL